MSYDPTVDFLGLSRLVSGAVRAERMPGLDYTVAALARAGLISLSVGQTAPIVNQPTTAWFRPSVPSWVAEGTLFLWDPTLLAYALATPALWTALLAPGAYLFQSVTTPTAAVASNVTLLGIQRASPATTGITLPPVATRAGRALQVVDWSSAVVGHAVTLTPFGAETIMRLPAFNLFSTADQLAGVTLQPSTDLNGWVIAP